MFVHPRSKAVEAFTPPALPGFIAIPTSIPDHPAFAALRFTVGLHTRHRSVPAPRLDGQPGSFRFILCCSMLSATPEREAITRH
jgi:hypothetical protein